MLRFIGTASITPSSAVKNTQADSTGQGRWRPPGTCGVTLSSSSAGMAETIRMLVENPAADAVDCMQLVSRIDIGVRARRRRRNARHSEKATMHAVSATLDVHGVLSPM